MYFDIAQQLGILHKRIFALSQSSFTKNVSTMAFGGSLAQIITISFSPLLTRIYGPEVFGIFGSFTSIVAMFGPVAAFAYPIAIVLPAEEEEAVTITKLSLILALLSSFLLAIVIFLLKKSLYIERYNNLAPYLLFLPFAVFCTSAQQIVRQWAIRSKRFKENAKTDLAHSLLMNSSKCGFGHFFRSAYTLILIQTFGLAFYVLFLGKSVCQKFYFNKKSKEKKNVALKYYAFPAYRAPQIFLNSLTQGGPILLLTAFFGPAVAGLYAIGKRVLILPNQLVGDAVGAVFYSRLAEAKQNGEKLSSYLVKVIIVLAIIGIIPFGIIVIWGPKVFSLVYGTEWLDAGIYARWLSIWLYFSFISRPIVKTIPVFDMQKLLLWHSVVLTVISMLAIIVGKLFFDNDVSSIIMYSLIGTLMNLLLLLFVLRKAYTLDMSNEN